MAGTTSRKYSLSELNEASTEDFVRIVGPIFEHSSWIAELAAPHRPYSDIVALITRMTSIVADSGLEKQLALIQAHPDLAGRLAQLGQLTVESTNEQASAGLDQIDKITLQKLQSLNERYKARFAFPFIICARLNNVSSILNSMEARLPQTRDQEISTALVEISKIAELRLRDLLCLEN